MAWRGREGVVYVCGEWEHGQLGLPLERSFGDPSSIDPPPTPYQTPVPSTGVRINDKGEEVYPLPAIDSNEAVSHPGSRGAGWGLWRLEAVKRGSAGAASPRLVCVAPPGGSRWYCAGRAGHV
jgi:hypothetical protein